MSSVVREDRQLVFSLEILIFERDLYLMNDKAREIVTIFI